MRTRHTGSCSVPGVIAGKDADGRFLREHRHAFFLPTAEARDARWLTHVTVTAAGGFGPDEVAALNGLRTLQVDDQRHLRVQLVGLGGRQDFAPAPGRVGRLAVRHAVRGHALSQAPRHQTRPARGLRLAGASSCIYFDRNCSAARTCRRSSRSS